MTVYALSPARGDYTRKRVITHAYSTTVTSRFSFTPSPGSQPRRDCTLPRRQGENGVQRCHVCAQQKARRCQSAAAAAAEPIAFGRTDIAEPEEEDFYSILGVVCSLCYNSVFAGVRVAGLDVYLQSYNADESQLKKAYYAIMRECHPDLSRDEESSEYSTVINEIYEVLFKA